MLAGLDKIDWSRLIHPYGDGDDIPDLLHELTAADEDTRSNAREMLSCRLGDGAPVETMLATVPFLIEIAAHPDVAGRQEILDELAGIAGLAADDGPGGGSAGAPNSHHHDDLHHRAASRAGDRAWRWAARELIESHLATFLALLADPDPPVRIGASRVLAQCWGRAAELAPEIIARVPAQADNRVRAAFIMALAELARHTGWSDPIRTHFEAWTRPGEAPVVRLAAALGLAWSSPSGPAPGVVAILCATAAAAWSDFEAATGRSLGFVVGRVLRGHPEARLRFLRGPIDGPDAEVRRSARSAAAQLAFESRSATPAVAAAFGGRLASADRDERRHLVGLLAGFGVAAAEASAPLVAALVDADLRVRTEAALALAGAGDPRALPVLIERVGSYRPTGLASWGPLRLTAGVDEDFSQLIAAIGDLGSAARVAVPTLVALLQGPPGATPIGQYRPAEIAFALGRIGLDARAAVPTLIALMVDRPEARANAALALAAIGGPEARAAIPLLDDWLGSPDSDDRVIAAEALARIDQRPERVLPVLIERLQAGGRDDSRAARVIGILGEAAEGAIPALVECLAVDPASDAGGWLRLEAAVALWRIERRDDRALPVLVGLLEDPGPAAQWIFQRAAEALGEMGGAARPAADLLRRAVAGDERSTGQYLPSLKAIGADDAFLAAVVEALRRIETDSSG